MATFRVIARTKYGDPSTDILRDFSTIQEAREFITGLGFRKTKNVMDIEFFGLPFADDNKFLVAGYGSIRKIITLEDAKQKLEDFYVNNMERHITYDELLDQLDPIIRQVDPKDKRALLGSTIARKVTSHFLYVFKESCNA